MGNCQRWGWCLQILLSALCIGQLVNMEMHFTCVYCSVWETAKVGDNLVWICSLQSLAIWQKLRMGCKPCRMCLHFWYSTHLLWAVTSFEIVCLNIFWHAQIFVVCSLSLICLQSNIVQAGVPALLSLQNTFMLLIAQEKNLKLCHLYLLTSLWGWCLLLLLTALYCEELGKLGMICIAYGDGLFKEHKRQ